MNAKPYSFRLDPELKAEADKLFTALGLNTNAAVAMFFRQAIAEQAFPFTPSLRPNAETLAAMRETEDILSGKVGAKRYSSFSDLLHDIEAEGDEEV